MKSPSKSRKPKRAQGTGRRQEALRWTIQRAATEFGHDRTQLERRRRALGIEPGDDGCFTSQDIALMIFGDKEAEQIGLIAAQRREVEMRNQRAEGELMPVERVAILGERYVTAVRQVVLNSRLSDAEKKDALEEIVQLQETDWSHEAREAAKK